jgi:hypothetical protein
LGAGALLISGSLLASMPPEWLPEKLVHVTSLLMLGGGGLLMLTGFLFGERDT